MNISVLVIAHNEERHIAKCLDSLMEQTLKPDEIVLIAHNCTDGTVEIAEKYKGLKIVRFNGEAGIVAARLKGIESVSGNIVCCIDGDSYAETNWLEEMVRSLGLDGNVLVGSYVSFDANYLGLENIVNNRMRKNYPVSGTKAAYWIWGPSFCFSSKYKEKIRQIYLHSISMSRELGLARNPDDVWLGIGLLKAGNLLAIDSTTVYQHPKERSPFQIIKRLVSNNMDIHKIKKHLGKATV